MNLEALITRLERCIGADREVDARIWAELDGRDVTGPISSAIWSGALFGRSRKPPHDECFIWQPGRAMERVPCFTGSIDAALTLVPEGNFWWALDGGSVDGAGDEIKPSAVVWAYENGPHISQRAYASTPSLALCIASLKARMVK